MYKPSLITLLTAFVTLAAGAAPKNILLLCIDDLRPELASFGQSYIHSPNIDQLAEAGRPFFRHYVNAPSCGPSRCTLLTGRYGAPRNDALFQRAKMLKENPDAVMPSMPEWFRTHGYTTVSVGKVSHHPGGLGGADWNDENSIEIPNAWNRSLMPCGDWQHPRGAMHGLANGQIRVKKVMKPYQSAEGPDTIYPDGLIADEGIRQLEELAADGKPFFLAIGLIKPHLPFGSPKKYMAPYEGVELPPIPHPAKPKGITTWSGSGEFFGQYNHEGKDPRKDADYADLLRRHYAACVTYADKHVGDILARLDDLGLRDDTVVVLWGDHGWHLGEHAVWGKHTLFEESLRSPLIISFPGLGNPGAKSDAVVSTLDIFPTLCELTSVPTPGFAQGKSLVPQLKNPVAPGHSAYAYWGGNRTLRTDRYRLTLHQNGAVELYDHTVPDAETRNVAAQHPQLVEQLKTRLAEQRQREPATPKTQVR